MLSATSILIPVVLQLLVHVNDSKVRFGLRVPVVLKIDIARPKPAMVHDSLVQQVSTICEIG